jgi:hypothetical protein
MRASHHDARCAGEFQVSSCKPIRMVHKAVLRGMAFNSDEATEPAYLSYNHKTRIRSDLIAPCDSHGFSFNPIPQGFLEFLMRN